MSAGIATLDLGALDTGQAPDKSLGVSVAMSAVFHLAVIVLLASMHSSLSLAPSNLGLTAPLTADLVEERIRSDLLEPLPRMTSPEGLRALAPMPTMPVAAAAAMAVADDTQVVRLDLPEYAHLGPPSPNGRVAVGPVANPERISAATAARLLQRFPTIAARTPRLNGAVITSYPIDAARSHVSTQIAAILTIDAAGRIVNADTKLVPDNPMFRPAILAALERTNFLPAEAAGKPVEYWAILVFSFDIDSAGSNTASRH